MNRTADNIRLKVIIEKSISAYSIIGAFNFLCCIFGQLSFKLFSITTLIPVRYEKYYILLLIDICGSKN